MTTVTVWAQHYPLFRKSCPGNMVAHRMKWIQYSEALRTCIMAGHIPGYASGHLIDFLAIARKKKAFWLQEECCFGLNRGQVSSVLAVLLGDAVVKWGTEIVDDVVWRAWGCEIVQGRGGMNYILLEIKRESTMILPSVAWKLINSMLE